MIVVVTTLIFIIILIVLVIHCYFYQKIAKSIEIIQINDITKENLEETVKNNKPIVIENIVNNLKFTFKDNTEIKLGNNFPINDKCSKGKKQDYFKKFPDIKLCIVKEPLKNELPSIFNTLIKNYHSPLSFNINNYYYFITDNFKRQITRTNLSRNIYIVIEGDCYFRLYHPKHIKDIKFISNIDDKEDISLHKEGHLKFNKLEYIDIIIRKDQGIIIPRYWAYTFYTKENCILINSISSDIIGNILNIFTI